MKLKYFLAFLAIICICQNIHGQIKLKGIVQDAITQKKLIGANIEIADLKIGVHTDNNGAFEIANIKPGTYTLEFSILGYASEIQKIRIHSDTILIISLQTAVSELNEVIVTAVSRGTEINKNPVIIKAIDKHYLNQNGASNIIDALKYIPGISQISNGVSISKPIIRGLGYNRVITLYNGIKQEGQQWGDEHGVEIDEYDIDRIEIVKGPGSLMYGSDGIAGVVNFLSPKPPHLGQIKSQVLTNYQTNNRMLGTSITNAGNINGLQWQARISQKMAGNYHNKWDGIVYNSGFKETNANVFLGVNKRWGHSHFALTSYNTHLNLIEGERNAAGAFLVNKQDGTQQEALPYDLKGYKWGFPFQKVNHFKLSLDNYFLLKNGSVNASVALQNNKRKEFGDATMPNDIALYFNLNTANYNLRYNFNEKKGWETSVGIGGMWQSNTNKGLEFLIPEYTSFDAGAFVNTQKKLTQKIILAGGLRMDNRSLQANKLMLDSNGIPTTFLDSSTLQKFASIQSSYKGISGSLGLVYRITKASTAKLNISRGFRAPTMAELASNGKHEGTYKYELGNPYLKPEVSHQIDLAYFVNDYHITLECTPFVNFISNYIYTHKMLDSLGNDIIIDPNDPAPAFQFVQGNARLIGGEIYLDIHPHPLDWLHLGNSFSMVRAIQYNQTDSTKNLPFIPAPKYTSELKAQWLRKGKAVSNIYIKTGVDYYFAQKNIFSAYNTETKTPSYTLWNAGFGGQINDTKKGNSCSIFVSGENLANTAYQSHLSKLKYAPINPASGRMGIYNMGRNISVKLIFNF